MISPNLATYLKGRVHGTVLDIGAGNGEYSALFARLGGKVISLETSLRWNPPKGIRCQRVAAGTEEGVAEVYAGGAIIHKSPSWSVVPKVKVETRRGDSFTKEASVIRVNAKDPIDVLRSCSGILPSRPVILLDTSQCRGAEPAVTKLLEGWRYVRGTIAKWGGYVYAPTRLRVCVVTYNRPQLLTNLLTDLGSQGVGDVHIYDDASTVVMPQEIAAKYGYEWHRFVTNNGKKGFYRIFNRVFAHCKDTPQDTFFIFLPDDVRICDQFVARAYRAWNSIPANNKSCLTLQAERYRDAHECWTGFAPVDVNKLVTQNQWVDGLFMCSHRALKCVNYSIPPPGPGRWERDPNRSSGVWEYFSKALHSSRHGMYRVKHSLVVHVMGESKMHGELRRRQPIAVHRFIDGKVAHARLITTEPIQVSLASIPSREANLKRVVDSLLPQCDVLRVYLNGYERIPDFLKLPTILVETSQRCDDRGDAGKFYWSAKGTGYQFTCDDDLVYPPGYVIHMVEAIERYGRKCAVGLHGIVMNPEVGPSYYRSRSTLHWRNPLPRDREVHLLGTGVLAYHSSTVKVRAADFRRPNMADIWFGLLCHHQGVPTIAVAHPGAWLKHLKSPWTIYDRERNSDQYQAHIAGSVKWKMRK